MTEDEEDVNRSRTNRAVLIAVAVIVILGVIVAGGVAWYLRGPGPMDFAGGSTVKLADLTA